MIKKMLFSLFLCGISYSTFSQINNSTNFEISTSEVLYTSGLAADNFIQGNSVIKFVYNTKRKEIIIKSIDLSNSKTNYEKSVLIEGNVNILVNQWLFHADTFSYFLFCDKKNSASQESYKIKYCYYQFNRKTGELKGPLKEHTVEKGFNDYGHGLYRHHLSRDSSIIVRENINTKHHRDSVTLEIMDLELNVLKTLRFQKSTAGLTDYIENFGRQIRVSNEGNVAVLEVYTSYEESKRYYKNALFQFNENGEAIKKIVDLGFDAMGGDFFYGNDSRLCFIGVYGKIAGKLAEGFFCVKLDEEGESISTWRTPFSNEFLDDFGSDGIKETISNWQTTKMEFLSNGNILFVGEKVYVKQHGTHPRRHNQNVYVSIVSPEGKIINSVKVPKFVLNSQYGKGTLNSEVLIDDEYAYVFTEESKSVVLPTDQSASISLTNAIHDPFFVCYKVNLSDGVMDRYQLFNLRMGEYKLEFFPKKIILNKDGDLNALLYIPKKKGNVMLDIKLK